uniref:Capsid protein n=1 Tax=viral metagenome TaxID=1070528 RepID=A0A6M3LBS4_9ZZZZ
MKFIAVAASLTKPDSNGEAFSLEALQQITEQCKGKPIHVNFDTTKPPIGIVSSGKVIDDKVEIKGELFPYAYPKNGFIVPGYSVEKSSTENNVQIHTDIKLMDFGLTQMPSDRNITEIKEDDT